MPTLPVVQPASDAWPRRASSCTPVRGRSASRSRPWRERLVVPPEVGQPSEWPVPGDSACTTANPRGTHVDSYRVLIVGLVLKAAQNGGQALCAGGIPSSWSTPQLLYRAESA